MAHRQPVVVDLEDHLADPEEYLALTASSRRAPNDVSAELSASINGGDISPQQPDLGEEDASPGPYYGSSSSGNSSNSPRRPRLLTASESGISSDGEYEFHDSDVEYSDEESEESEEPSGVRGRANKSKDPSNRHADTPAISKLQSKIQDRKRKGIELDSNGTRKGTVRRTTRGLEYLHNGDYIPAVYHWQIRGQLLRHTDAQGAYTEVPISGFDADDRTSFKAEHKDFEFKVREKRPEVCFLWEDPEQHPGNNPKFMYFGGQIVLSTVDKPVKLWPELPLTLSGQCEGLRMEFYRRLNPAITMNDLKAIMPRQTCKGKNLVYKSIKTPALANRMARDRCKMGIKAWDQREGSDVKEYRMLQTMPEAKQRRIIETNSVKCHRDLTDAEVDYIEEGNKATDNANGLKGTPASLAKAGPRLLDEESRKKYLEKKQQRKKDSKKIDRSSVQLHHVIPEALKPAKRRKHRAFSSAAPSSIPEQPRIKRERDEDNDDHGILDSSQYGYGGHYMLEGTAPQKKRRYSPAVYTPRSPEDNDKPGRLRSSDVASDQGNTRFVVQHKARDQLPGRDFRFTKPSTEAEQFEIQVALNLTRDDFQRYIGYPPFITTDRYQSYMHQLGEIQSFFEGCIPGPHAAPKLESWGYWTSSIDGWRHQLSKTPEKPYQGYSAPAHNVQAPSPAESRLRDIEGETLLEEAEQLRAVGGGLEKWQAGGGQR
ncbi:MAG: hypothetical protein Q9166_005647 [cf. Caloplaca sp. 2 TL-2023]